VSWDRNSVSTGNRSMKLIGCEKELMAEGNERQEKKIRKREE
jgi:hypothetical protein